MTSGIRDRSTRAPLRATLVVFPNEPCFELAEIERTVPKAGAGIHRFQIVTVIRNDEKVIWEKDMGKAESFTAEPFILPGAVRTAEGHFEVLETVGRLQGAADDWRAYYSAPKKEEPTDLKKGFEEYSVRRRDARKGRKRFSMARSR